MANLPAPKNDKPTVPAKRTPPAVDFLGVGQLFVDGLDADPLAMARRLSADAEKLEAAARFAGLAEDHGETMRLAVGAVLVSHKAAFDRGEWTPWIEAFADRVGRSSSSLGRWMTAAQRRLDLPPPKGAIPSRRGPRPPVNPSHPCEGSNEAPTLPVTPSEPPATASDDVAEPEAAAPIRDKPPFVSAPKPKPKATESLRKATAEANVVACLDGLLDADPNTVTAVAKGHRTKTVAAGHLLTRALADAKTTRAPAAVFDAATCAHPKGKRQVKSWGSVCGDCGLKVG